VSSLISTQLPRITRKIPHVRLLGISFTLFAIAAFLLPRILDLWFIIIPLFIYGIGRGFGVPSIQCLLSESTSAEYRAAVMALNGTAVRTGQTLGPLLTGLVFIFWGIEAPFFLCAGVAVAFLIPVFILNREFLPKKDPEIIQ
jgi:MFS family permease